MSYVLEINDVAQLDHIRLLWDALLRQTRGASFFQSVDWLEAYWRHFGADEKLRVLVVYSAGRPIGILPLCVRTERSGLGNLAVLTYPLHDWSTFYGPIGPNPAATLLAGMRHVRQTPQDWDLIDLRWIGSDTSDRGRTEYAMRAVGLGVDKEPWASTGVVDLSQTWASYFAARTNSWQQNYLRSEQRLSELGEVTCVHFRPRGDAYGDGDPRWDLYDAWQAIAQSRGQGSTSPASEAVRPFLRDLHAVASKKGAVDVNLLLIDSQPCAFAYHYHFGGSVVVLQTGVDPELSCDGADQVICARAIRNSFEQGDRRYELGRGSIESQRDLLTCVKTSYRCTHFPATGLQVQALRLKRWLRRKSSSRSPASEGRFKV